MRRSKVNQQNAKCYFIASKKDLLTLGFEDLAR